MKKETPYKINEYGAITYQHKTEPFPDYPYRPEDAFDLPKQDQEPVDHPSHYGGAENPYEAIKVIRAWNLGFSLGNTIKYISRAGKKNPDKKIEDLRKALWYLQEEIDNELERSTGPRPGY